MILFASGRTDIPAFYADWLINRIHAGFVDVRNPYFGQQVTRYRLDPDVVDCLVFCTKNPMPLIPLLGELKGFPLYFFVTITPYGKEIEPFVPQKERVMEAVRELAAKIGQEQVAWRYDPIFVDSTYTVAAHIRAFRSMAEKLRGATERCIISFVDLYEKTKKNFSGIREVRMEDRRFLAESLARIGREAGISLESCAEKEGLENTGVKKGCCVSRKIVERASGQPLRKQLPIQRLREHCSCLAMHDIGAYNSCPHLCRYCYANYNASLVRQNFACHDADSPLLIGQPQAGDVLHEAEQESYKENQLLLF